MANSMSSWCAADATFGPLVGSTCRGGLDFTLLFELTILQYLPCGIFLLGALWQYFYPSFDGSVRLASTLALRLEKLTAFGALIACYVARMVVNGLNHTACWQIAVGAAGIEAFTTIVALFMVDRYCLYSTHSSTWVTSWLALTSLLDMAYVRTQWLVHDNRTMAVVATLAIASKLVCLVVESIEKPTVLADGTAYSPEELASPLDRLLFGWTYRLLGRGFLKVLSADHLVSISADLKTDPTLHPLPHLVKDMPRAFFAPLPARIFLMGFSLAQPFVVHATLKYTLFSNATIRGDLLIGAYVLVFVGYALSNGLYWYLVDRLRMKARSRLIELIYDCTYRSSQNFDNRATPSLITTDIESFMLGIETFHETWASLLQISVAVGILSVYIGWACVGPIAACFGCLVLTAPLVIWIAPALIRWNSAVSDRIATTTSILRRLRDVRLLGLGGIAFNLILQLRRREISKALRFRQILFFVILFSQAPLALCPLVTFALYAFKVDSGQGSAYEFVLNAFTALNLLGLIFTPFTQLLQSAPLFGAGMGALFHIQRFVDAAQSSAPPPEIIEASDGKSALRVTDASFGWTEDLLIIKDLGLDLPLGHFLAITGPVGSGKSTILAGILRQTHNNSGLVIRNAATVSYCPQNPWIMSGTVRENIVCGLQFDREWFNTTVAACALSPDLKHWEHGDLHDVGNDGNNLSGGQRQRVALARAVYARNVLVFLDDPLSGLDSASSQHIQRELLSPHGLFRRSGTSVVMVTHSVDFISHANQVLALHRNGDIAFQGKADDYLERARKDTQSLTLLREIIDGPQVSRPDYSQSVDNADQSFLALAREDANRKSGDWTVYWYYAKASGRFSTLMFISGAAITAAGWQLGVYWIKKWSEDALSGHPRSVAYYIGVYSLITAVAGVGLGMTAAGSMVFMVSRASYTFHSALLSSVSRASVSYFGAADIGITLNRFIQDLRLIDWELPLALTNTVTYLFICISQAVVIALASRFMGIAVGVAVVLLIIIQRFYLHTSRQLRLLDIEAKAPLYTNFHETIEGIPSIRAYGERLGELLRQKQRIAANDSQQPMFLLYVIQRLLLLVIDMVVAILATVLITLVVKDPSIARIASLGTGLVNLTLFNQFLTFVIRYWTELENSMGAISRIKTFAAATPSTSGTRPERYSEGAATVSLEDLQSVTAPDIRFENVSALFVRPGDSTSESSTTVAALDNVTLHVPAGRKVAIVGRSGSGKSTLLSCLTRIMQPSYGTIRIGGTDIANMDQESVQSNLVCVTQAFFFLPQISLRDNLDLGVMLQREDPLRERQDVDDDDTGSEDMVSVLKDLEMWSAVESRGGLGAVFDPAVWSVGEIQLLNLSRAVLKARRLRAKGPGRGWRILLLDEATSSVDRQTAALMRRVIRADFHNYTIIAVEHRFEDARDDLDWIVRLDKGHIAQEGTPADMIA